VSFGFVTRLILTGQAPKTDTAAEAAGHEERFTRGHDDGYDQGFADAPGVTPATSSHSRTPEQFLMAKQVDLGRYARIVFRQVPDADYVYCEDVCLLLSTAYVRWCQQVWEVALSATTWGELADRLAAVDPALARYLFTDDPDDYFTPETSGHDRADAFDARSYADYDAILYAFPFGGGNGQYGTWWADLPGEVMDLVGNDEYAYFEGERLKTALELISLRGEVAIEDCALIDELTGSPPAIPPV
jgi:hypothetical protein